jgi:hypothetical protein
VRVDGELFTAIKTTRLWRIAVELRWSSRGDGKERSENSTHVLRRLINLLLILGVHDTVLSVDM